jgi:hypothetical protein
MLDDERLIALRQVACERHTIGERRCVDRLGSIISQLFEQALAKRLERRAFDLPTAGLAIDAGAGVGADDQMRDDDPAGLALRGRCNRNSGISLRERCTAREVAEGAVSNRTPPTDIWPP